LDVAPEWKLVELKRLVEPDRGISYGIVQPGRPVSAGVPIVRVSDVRDGRIATQEPLRVSADVEAAYARTRLLGGELLLTLVGTVGEAAIVPPELSGWNVARAVAVIPVRKEIGSYWVKVALRAPAVRQIIESRLNTTVQATLNLRDVAQLPIILPPRREREAIAHILGTLDEKIELNRRMNETLEATARGIFKSWFVDFDPVRAKVENRDTGLPNELAELLHNSFEESELEEVPEGWVVATIGNVATLSRDTVTPMDAPDEFFDHFSIPAYDDGRSPKREQGATIKSNKFLVPSDSVLLSKLNPRIPRVWLPQIGAERRAVSSTEFLVLRPRPPVDRAYLYCLLSSAEFAREFETLVTGTSGSHQRVKPENLLQMRHVVAPDAIIARFAEYVRPLLARISTATTESLTLSAIRDTLLPKLISGELRVRDAERMLAHAPV
jgi:type I restriction enzyme S subunit